MVVYASGNINLHTLYQSKYTAITDVGYTKHYYIEGQRIASKLWGGFSGMENSSSITLGLEPLHGNYDAGLSVWLSVDPMSDNYPSMSAYNYCAWNPVMLVDPDGREVEEANIPPGKI